jgi:hypothetical protein
MTQNSSCASAFNWVIEGNPVPLIFDVQADIYVRNGIGFSELSHIESLGLIKFDNLAGFLQMGLPKTITPLYYSRPVNLSFPADADNSLALGRVLLTRAGVQFAPVCGSAPIEGFFDLVYGKWASESLVPK